MEKGSKKRKVRVEENELKVEVKTRRLEVIENSGNSGCESGSSESDRVLASCCSSNGSSDKSLDLEVSNLEVTSAGESVEFRERTETTPTNEAESTAKLSHETSSGGTKMLLEAEIEEFFAVAEENMQKEFIDKYNYDIVKDEPLPEGRYEWVPVKLKP